MTKLLAELLCVIMLISIVTVIGPPSTQVNAADTNIAVGKAASADSGNATAAYANDDNIYTQWCADDGNANHWWKVDLEQAYDLTGTEVVWEANYLMEYKVEASADNINWTVVVDKTNNTNSSQVQRDNFTSSGKRYVRITITGMPSGVWAAMYEFRVFGNAPATDKVATPVFSPVGGTYETAQSVTISCATSGATIRYTTDGSTPTAVHNKEYAKKNPGFIKNKTGIPLEGDWIGFVVDCSSRNIKKICDTEF